MLTHIQLTWSSSEVVCFSSGVLGVSFGVSSALGADVGSSDAGSAPDKTKAANSITGHSPDILQRAKCDWTNAFVLC